MVWKDKAAVFGSVQQDRRPRQGGRVPSTIGRLHPTGRSEEPLLLREKKKKTMSRWFPVPGDKVLKCSLYAESPVLRLLPGLSLTAGMHKRKKNIFLFSKNYRIWFDRRYPQGRIRPAGGKRIHVGR